MEGGTQNTGIAFALVIAAGAASGIGAALVFFPKLVHLANRHVLAASLAMAAGVMLYVSMVDIYTKAIDGFVEQGHTDGNAFIYTTLTFFAGILFMMFMNKVVIDGLLGGKCGASNYEMDDCDDPVTMTAKKTGEAAHSPTIPTHSDQPVEDLEDVQKMAEQLEKKAHDHEILELKERVATQAAKIAALKRSLDNQSVSSTASASHVDEEAPPILEGAEDSQSQRDTNRVHGESTQNKRLVRMGISTSLAIALHNFPEGLVTFIAYMSDPTVGVVLAMGIALHNMPEGCCVAMPIYYATGSRWKGFLWGLASGVSEPLGALIGWAALKGSFSGNTYGILFGLVGGIMTYISIEELLPTALRYDPENRMTTHFVLFGMLIIAGSLMLFSV